MKIRLQPNALNQRFSHHHGQDKSLANETRPGPTFGADWYSLSNQLPDRDAKRHQLKQMFLL